MIEVDLSLDGVGKWGCCLQWNIVLQDSVPCPETRSPATSLPRLSIKSVSPGFYLGPLYEKSRQYILWVFIYCFIFLY